MSVTEEAKTLPADMQRWVKLARIAVGLVVGGVVTIGSAITTYRIAADDSRLRTQQVKDKAESGYQVTKEAVGDHDKRIAALEATVRQLSAQQHPPARRGSRPRPITPVAPATPPSKSLPSDLDKAQKQVYQAVALPASRDAAP